MLAAEGEDQFVVESTSLSSLTKNQKLTTFKPQQIAIRYGTVSVTISHEQTKQNLLLLFYRKTKTKRNER